MGWPGARAGGGRRGVKRVRTAAISLLLAASALAIVYDLPEIMAALHVYPPMPPDIHRHLRFPRDGEFRGNDDAPDLVLYRVERRDPGGLGAVDIHYNTASNAVWINVTNLKNLTVSSRAVYADEAFKIAGINWKDDTNLYKQYFADRQKLTVYLQNNDTRYPQLDSLAFLDAPRPTGILVDGVAFSDATYDPATGSISTTKLPPKPFLKAVISFVEEQTPPPVAVASADRTVVKRGESVRFDGSNSYGQGGKSVKFHYWDFGDGGYGIGARANHTYSAPDAATYTVILVVEDTGGLVNSTRLSIDYNRGDIRPPVADAGPDQKFPEDFPIVLDGSRSGDNVGIANYTWIPGDGSILFGQRVNHSYSRSGVYRATLVATDAAGNAGTDVARIEVVNLPPYAIAGPDVGAALNQSLLFDGSFSGDTPSDAARLVHTWEFGDGTGGSGALARHAYSREGVFTVNLTVTDDDGATGRDSLSVKVEDRPNLPPTIDPIRPVFVALNFPWFLNLVPYVHDDNVTSLVLRTSSVFTQPDPTNVTRLRLRLHYTDEGMLKENVRINITDGQYAASTTLDVTVLKGGWPPVYAREIPTQRFDEDRRLDDAFNARDHFQDNATDVLAFTAVAQGNVFASVDNATGGVSLWARPDWNGVETVAILAQDQTGAWVEGSFKVVVVPVNDPPRVLQQPLDVSVKVGDTWKIDLRTVFADVDDDVLAFTSSAAQVTIDQAAGMASWRPERDQESVDVVFTANDGLLSNSTRSVRLVSVRPGLDPILTALVAAVGIVGALGVGLLYRRHRWRYETHEVFVVSEAGVLAAHVSSGRTKLVHEELVAGMLTAIRQFVKESFAEGKEEKGGRGLGGINYEDFVIAVEQGRGFFLAAVITGADSPPLRTKMKESVGAIERKWGKVLRDWQGDLDEVEGMERVLSDAFGLGDARAAMDREAGLGSGSFEEEEEPEEKEPAGQGAEDEEGDDEGAAPEGGESVSGNVDKEQGEDEK